MRVATVLVKRVISPEGSLTILDGISVPAPSERPGLCRTAGIGVLIAGADPGRFARAVVASGTGG